MLVKHSQRTVKCKRCGVRDFYWMHDTDKTNHPFRRCNDPSDDCKVHGLAGGPVSWVLCDTAGRPHKCQGTTVSVSETEDTEEVLETPTTVSTVSETVEPIRTRTEQLEALEALQKLLGSNQTATVDEDQVRQIVKQAIADLVLPTTVIIENKVTLETKDVGITHKVFPEVLSIVQCDNAWLTGPAGVGKTKLAHQIAEALEIPFGFISLTATTPVSEIVGYMDANGNHVRSLFREIYEHGGVFLFDECDNGNPNTLGKVNAALANDSMAFADGMVKRHPDCHILAAANTFGTGPDRMFVGRMQLDFATLDRFAVVEMPVDEALETHIAYSQCEDHAKVDSLLAKVRSLRSKARELKLPIDFTPRASIQGAKLLQAGLSMDRVIAVRVRKGISDTDWNRLNG